MTFAPGKKGASKYAGGRWERDVQVDLDRLRTVHEVDLLISLIEGEEFARYGIDDLLLRAGALGIATRHVPIRDVSVPRTIDQIRNVVDEVVRAADDGMNVVIHCIGGLGRTGTVAGCVLGHLGWAPSDAFPVLAKLRGPNCPETEEQREFVRRYWREKEES